ncbi:hypothetical protein B2J93_4266 [Marssonina coronariae]|uniref:Uncharacterized protein n=1 Tax=Diplocarpon coronariae TaxID=2795749 RepID=A0A218YXH7_9HELO|nr:hypothetical protein B2J93_4266 [Marssonina coronariae]
MAASGSARIMDHISIYLMSWSYDDSYSATGQHHTSAQRNGTESFSADSPAYYEGDEAGDVIPADAPPGRNNNPEFEGMTITGDSKNLYVLPPQTKRKVLNLKPSATHDFSNSTSLTLKSHDLQGSKMLPSSSSCTFITDNSSSSLETPTRGTGMTALCRSTDILTSLISNPQPISKVTTYDCADCSIGSESGVLGAGISPATYCPLIDLNLHSQLNRFGAHNGDAQDVWLLNEKWESIGMVPVDGLVGDDDEWLVLSLTNNDFNTQISPFRPWD